MSCVSPPCPVDRLSQVIIDCNKSWEGGLTPGWHLTDYAKRKQLTVSGSAAGAVTNYQLRLTVHFGNGVDAGSDVYLGGVCRSDFHDLRFTKTDGTLLDYWVESYVASDNAVVWVEFDSIPAAPGTVDFYLYYRYPSATSVSSGDDTFQFFDDFSGGLGKWSTVPPGWAIVAGKFHSNSAAWAYADISDYTNIAFRVTVNVPDESVQRIRRIALWNAGLTQYNSLWARWDTNQAQMFKTAEVSGGIIAHTLNINTDYVFELRKIGNDWSIYIDGTLLDTEAAWLALTLGKLGLRDYDAVGTDWDTVILRNIISPEPTISAWGAEESYQIFYGITNLKELAAGMTEGDLFVHNGTVLARISPGPIGSNLMSHDMGFMLTWEFPP
jgi:hypothetical protein